jgi:hypothetical protein
MTQKEVKKPKNSIAVMTCWIGNYPWYFPYFVHTCSYNSSVDFIIITDNEEPIANKPANIKIINKNLAAIKALASEKLGFEVSLEAPYKLCDFKPAYGLIFAEYIKEYVFWGHADIDLVYGSIRDFMTDEVLNNHDIISCRHDYITGSFCLFRNNDYCNSLFTQSIDYKKVFTNDINCCFDECNYLFSELEQGGTIFDFPDNLQSMTYVVKDAERKGKLKAHFDFIIVEGTPGKIKWDKGHVYYKDMYEAMYYHLIKFKTESKRPKVFDPIPDTFYFTPRTIRLTP